MKATPSICRDEILRCLELLAEPEQVIELRLLGVLSQGRSLPLTMSGYFDSRQALATAAAKYGKTARGSYITLNPVNPALLARAVNRIRVVGKDDHLTTDTDIICRRWLPIDVDPVRPAGISSSAEEHGHAIQRIREIRDFLRTEGWPDPILADSGNGGHVLYRIDLPAADENIVKNCLITLAKKFDDERARVDQAVFNPSRIWKLYGTVSRKGDDLPDRPHRAARILESQ